MNAQTGSGKTLSFLLPILNKMLQNPMRTNTPTCLILVPVRELALQIFNELLMLSFDTKVKGVTIYGGVSLQRSISLLEKIRPNVLIACPGRLKQMVNDRLINLSTIDYLVIDEVDRMLDMGFIDDLEFIFNEVDMDKAQKVFCSATFPPEIKEMCRKQIKNEVNIKLPKVENSSNKNITHNFIWTNNKNEELDKVIEGIKQSDDQNAIIFCNKRSDCRKV